MLTVTLAILLLAQEDPAAWVERLMSDSIEERQAAARHLEDMGQAAVSQLEKAACGPDAERAGRAAGVLRRIEVRALVTPRMRQAVPDIESRLASRESWAQVFVLLTQEQQAGLVPRKDLLPFARKTLRAMTPGQADQTLRAIKDRGLRELAPELLDFCRNGPPEGLVAASLTLASWGGPEAISALKPRLQDPSSAVRVAATTALSLQSASESYAAVIGALQSKDPRVREEAARITGLYDLHGSSQVVAPLLEDPDAAVRKATLESLGRLRARPFSKAVAAVLRDKDPAVRTEAIRTLIALRAEEHLSDILRHLPETAEAEPNLLKGFGEFHWGSAIPYLTQRLRESKAPAARAAVIEALGELNVHEAAPALIALLPDERLGQAAYYALKQMAPRGVVASLMPLLEHGDEAAAESSLVLLIDSADPASLPSALRLLDHPRREVQARAEKLLKALRPAQAVPRIAARLQHKDPETAAAAVEILAGLRGLEVDALLRQAADSKEVLVRAAALMTLGYRGDPGSRDLLKKGLTDPNYPVRRAAVLGLERLGDPDLGRLMLQAVCDPEGDIAEHATYVLSHIKDKAWLADLEPLLIHEDAKVRYAAITVLRAHDARGFQPQLLALLKDTDPHVQKQAALLAAAWGSEKALPVLLPLLSEENPKAVIEAMSAIRGPALVKSILEWMKTAPYSSQWCGVNILGDSRSAEAVAPLREIFEREELDLRATALVALDKIVPFSTEELLRLADRDPDSAVRTSAINVLAARTPPLSVDVLLPLVKGLDQGWLEHFLTTIQRHPSAHSDPAWVRALADPRLDMRRACYIGAEVFRDPSGAAAVRPMLKDQDPMVRGVAAFALSSMRDVGAAEDLTVLLGDASPDVRMNAAWALGACKVRAAVPGLIRLLEDPFEEVQRAAINALGDLGERSSASALVRMLKDRNRLLADSALRGLISMEATEAVPALMAFIRTGHPYEASRAASGLGWLGAKEAAPLLRDLLHSSPRMRTKAAIGLTLLGHSEGAAVLIEEGAREPALNALRDSEAFNKLRRIVVPLEFRSSRRVFLEHAAREAGLKFECFEPSKPSEVEWLTGPRFSLSWASFLLEGDSTCMLVLDVDRLRVVDTTQGSHLHRAWWESRRK